MSQLRQILKPEFLNRIDEIIVFKPLLPKEIREVVRLQFNRLIERVKTRGIQVKLSDEACDLIAKAGWDPAESLRKMAEWSNGHFDPTVFQAFVKSLGIYPIGSLVRLNPGRLGIVVEQAEKSLLTPRIKVFYSTRSQARIKPILLDLSLPNCQEKIASREDPAKWNFPDLNELWSGQTGY